MKETAFNAKAGNWRAVMTAAAAVSTNGNGLPGVTQLP